ncbi:MAG: 2-amino-4-hydroxy-6-hydroxymethyldihydropteridine diphosphokinase [Clostridium sp.]
MDKIYLENVEIFANHGVFSEEKFLGQKFIISLELDVDLSVAAKTGDLNASVHYGELCHKIEEEFKKQSYDLIETACEEIANFVLFTYPQVNKVKVLLKKPWAPIGRHLDYAAVEVTRGWHEVYLSIGSNIGDKENNLREALSLIKENKYIEILKESSFIETEPWGFEEQDTFLNGAIKLTTILNPKELITFLLSVEEKMKRERILRWGPRIIDLDIIFYDDLVLEEEQLVIPHPRMEEREFVLKPLSEIAPYKVHPLLNKRVYKLLEELIKE